MLYIFTFLVIWHMLNCQVMQTISMSDNTQDSE